MTKHDGGTITALQSLQHLGAPNPRDVIPGQKPLRLAVMIVLLDDGMVTGKEKRAILGQVDLHRHEPRRVPGCMVE